MARTPLKWVNLPHIMHTCGTVGSMRLCF